jgi:hypothetical protein
MQSRNGASQWGSQTQINPMKSKKKNVKPKFQTHYHQKVGSHLKEVDPSSMDWSDNDSCFFYEIDRQEIEECDTRRLLHDLRPEVDNPLFRSGPGSVIFSVNGYDEDPRGLLQIPEFRAFVRKVQQSSPCWLYFAMPGAGWLRIILAARAVDCQVIECNGKLCIAVTKTQVVEFMEPQLKEYERLLELQGITSSGIDDHIYQTMQHSFPEFLSSPMHN